MFKKIILGSIVAVSMSVSMLAHAGENLMSRNHTNCPSTTITNHAACSTILGKEIGVAPAKQDHEVSAFWVGVACVLNKRDCVADLYMTDHCNQPGNSTPVATINFDTETGIKTITNIDNAYNFKVTKNGPFDASIDGGPENAADCPK